MAQPIHRPAGWREILEAPGDLKAEVLGGELILQPRPRLEHGIAQSNLSGLVTPPFSFGEGGPGGWWIAIEPDLCFDAEHIVSPDLVGWRRERVPWPPSERPVTTVPDWICEILSPASRRRDRFEKAELYLRGGVPFYWLLDLDARGLEAFEAVDGRWLRLGAWTAEHRAAVPPFEAIEIEIGRLFPPEPPAPAPQL